MKENSNTSYSQLIEKETGITLSDQFVFYSRENKDGVIAVSAFDDKAIKLFNEKKAAQRLETEIKLLRSFEGGPFASHAPAIAGEGSTSQGGRWLATTFCADDGSYSKLKKPENAIFHTFFQAVAPVMEKFYLAQTPQVISLDEWIESAQGRLSEHPSKNKLGRLLEEIKKESKENASLQLVKCLIHNDIHAENLAANNNNIVVLDWEGAFDSLLIIDALDPLRRFVRKNKWQGFLFWRFMRKKNSKLSKALHKYMQSFALWRREKFNAQTPKASERLSFLIYALERSLVTFEMRQLDRMKDKKGFEYKVYKAASTARH